MASTVKLPVIGQANKGTVVGVTIGGLAVAGYLIVRQQKKMKAQAAAATASQQAANSYGYGASAQFAYGYGSGYGNGYYGYGQQGNYYGYGASGGFYPQGYYGYGTTQPPGVVPNTTNAQWTQAAINQLTSEGYDAQSVSAALGAYVTGSPVPAGSVSMVQAAIAIEGYPPQPGPNGDPPGINQQGTPGGGGGGGQGPGGGGGGGGGGSSTVKVPRVVGETMDNAEAKIKAAGLVPTVAKWTTGKGTKVVVSTSPAGGASVATGSKVHLNLKKQS